MALLCPPCAFDNVRKVSVIYEQQTHTGISSGGGVGLALTPDGLAPVVGGTGGAYVNQSLAATPMPASCRDRIPRELVGGTPSTWTRFSQSFIPLAPDATPKRVRLSTHACSKARAPNG
jgi:hypothetical protein